MPKYFATRNIQLGKFAGQESVTVHKGDEISWDGRKARLGEMEDFFPSFDATVRNGWFSTVKPAKEREVQAPPAEAPSIRAAKSNDRVAMKTEQDFVPVSKTPITTGIHKEAKAAPKKLEIVSGDDDNIVVATNISTKGIPKREERVKPKGMTDLVEVQDGEVVAKSRFKTSTKSTMMVDK